jgi:hypothetical protein
MDPDDKARLLASMHAGRLIILCGAGLSMAAPSGLPSAAAVAEKCFQEYRLAVDPGIDTKYRNSLENFAEYFAGRGELKSIFIHALVPWDDFTRPPNAGHGAVADFLLTRAAQAGLSTNYDNLIERRAWDYGADFRGSLDGGEANTDSAKHSPLLKFHGCISDKPNTVWAPSQLGDLVISQRLALSKTWMAAHLKKRDLLVVGFWSDWEYLNHLIGEAVEDIDPVSVTVVDPSPLANLQAKAPELWGMSHAGNVQFRHVQESGAAVLNELRVAFSQRWLDQVLAIGASAFTATTGAACPPALLSTTETDSELLYDWRRDAEGCPNGKAARKRVPEHCDAVGMVHLLIRAAGGLVEGPFYRLNGRTVRVINAANKVLSKVRDQFVAAPAGQKAEIVIAVGAYDVPVPGNFVREGKPGSLIRPAAGGAWFDTGGGRGELGI